MYYQKDTTGIASKRRNARSTNNTIQAVRRSVVMADWCYDMHLGEMRHIAESAAPDRSSQISEMLSGASRHGTTLRDGVAYVVLITSAMWLHASGMMRAMKRRDARGANNTIQAVRRSVVIQ